ncbi:MAG: ORC1-type DNA replication protein [Candidatus Thermoplasmatota archaeon]|nr:ORC1-type DNA replication protein [Candidatus Thermoplasmatota archaeon]
MPKETSNTDIFRDLLTNEGLFKNREVMRPTYMPEILPHREREIKDLANILVPSLKGETPSNVFIYGKTGTGKTAVVKFVGKELLKKGEETGRKVNFIYMNCEIVDTQYRLLQNIANRFISEWNDHVPFTGWPTDEVYSKVKAMMDKEKSVTVVVLDEIDKLKGDEALYNLTRINSELDNARVSVIGISNDLKFTEFLDPRVKSSLGEESMIFYPYDAEQLQDILRARIKTALKPGIIEDEVIPLCAALSAQEHGDARRALDLLRVSAELAERSKSSKITRSHVRLAQNKIELDRVIEVVRTLPNQSKLVLYSIILLNKQNIKAGATRALTTGEVYDIYRELCKKARFNCLTQRRTADLISELDMLGIITARVISKGRHGRTTEIHMSSSTSSKDLLTILQEDDTIKELAAYKMKEQARLTV